MILYKVCLPDFIGWASTNVVCSFVSWNDHYLQNVTSMTSMTDLPLKWNTLYSDSEPGMNYFSSSFWLEGEYPISASHWCPPPGRLCKLLCPRLRTSWICTVSSKDFCFQNSSIHFKTRMSLPLLFSFLLVTPHQVLCMVHLELHLLTFTQGHHMVQLQNT